MGAPRGSMNAMTNGVYRSRVAAAKGYRVRKLPKGYRYVQSEASRYATNLHEDVRAAHGEVDRVHRETIEAAAAWHLHSLYVLRTLRVDHDSLTPTERVQLSSEVAKSVQKRADQVKQLGLADRAPADPWLTLHQDAQDNDTRVHACSGVQDAAETPNASDAAVGDEGGNG